MKSFFTTILVIAIICIIVVFGLYFSQFTILSSGNDVWGQFGDYIGGTLNPIFGFLGLIALLYTLVQNDRAIRISQIELQESRKEMVKSNKALDDQKAVLDLQAFEQTYFNLLELFNSRINGFEQSNKKGRAVLKNYIDNVESCLSNQYADEYIEDYKIFNEAYLGEVQDNVNLNTYFLLLYNILKFIDMGIIANKQFYCNILRAQLSYPELQLIFYNSLSLRGKEKLLPLIIKYDILQHLLKNDIIDNELLWDNWFIKKEFDKKHSDLIK